MWLVDGVWDLIESDRMSKISSYTRIRKNAHTHSFLVAGLPFALLKHAVGPTLHRLGLITDPSAVTRGRFLLYLPRLVMVILSFIQGALRWGG